MCVILHKPARAVIPEANLIACGTKNPHGWGIMFVDAGEVRVTARRAPHRVVIEVADPGRGVPDIDKEKLFLPYFSTKGRGTGLGLAIVHRIVNDHDGRISVHDNYPKGTRFEIELPA